MVRQVGKETGKVLFRGSNVSGEKNILPLTVPATYLSYTSFTCKSMQWGEGTHGSSLKECRSQASPQADGQGRQRHHIDGTYGPHKLTTMSK